MAKRFTDTNKYKKPFIRGLQGAYKLLWDYLYHDCDHAGVWIVDFEIAQLYVGKDMPVTKEDALKYFNADEKHIIEIDGGTKWFIPSFIEFQYGELNENNRAHNSVILILRKYDLWKNKPLISPLQGRKDMDMDIYNILSSLLKKVITVNNIELPEGFFDLILEWMKYKSEKKQGYKPIGLKNLIGSLLKESNSDIEIAKQMIIYSTSKNYTGLFKETSNTANANGNNKKNNNITEKYRNSVWDNEN